MKQDIQKAAALVESNMAQVDDYLFIACGGKAKVSAGGGNVFSALLITCLQNEPLRQVVIRVADFLRDGVKVDKARVILNKNIISKT